MPPIIIVNKMIAAWSASAIAALTNTSKLSSKPCQAPAPENETIAVAPIQIPTRSAGITLRKTNAMAIAANAGRMDSQP